MSLSLSLLFAEDTIPPTIEDCPSDVLVNIEEGRVPTSVLWEEPSAVDTSGNVTLIVRTHTPGQRFGLGISTVIYIFADPSNNLASCTFSIEVSLGELISVNCVFDIRH